MRNRKSARQTAGKRTLMTAFAVITLAFVINSCFSSALEKAALFSARLAAPSYAVQAVKSSLNAKPQAPPKSEAPKSDISEIPKATETSQSNPSTPADIIKMAEQYRIDYAAAGHDGVITERTYDISNATSSFGNITVRNTTPTHSINIEQSLSAQLPFQSNDISKPTVLIFHTHTTESYEMTDDGWFTNSYSTRSNDPSRNMVRVGTAICEELEKNGIGYIHDREIHDAQYTGAYDRSRVTIEEILRENPTIKIVLDVHRDAIHQSDTSRVKPTVKINGKKAAQIMIIAGCEDGKVKSFPSWEQNLTFALKLHQTAENMYPGLMRPILFSARKYNMDIVPCSVLLEVGSDSNTLQEAEYSGHLIGSAISEFVKENK